MTPFGKCLEEIRRSRKLKQNALALHMGINSSYVSALENGKKPPPSREVIRNLIHNLKLNEKEQAKLKESLNISQLTIKLPDDMLASEHELIHEVLAHVGTMSEEKIAYLRTTLRVI